MTPTELHEEMIKAALEAYDRVGRPAYRVSAIERRDMEAHLRERLSQVAHSVGVEMTLAAEAAYERGVEAGREAGYREGSDS